MELVILLLVGLGEIVVAGIFLRGRAKTPPVAPAAVKPVPLAPAAPTPAQPAAAPTPTPQASPLQQAFAQSSDNPIYELSIEGGSLTWNDAFYKVFGYTHSEQANSSEWWATHIHPDDALVVNEHMDKLLDPSFTGWEASYRFKKADGTYTPVTDHVLIRRNKEGQAESLLGTMSVQTAKMPVNS